MIGGNTVTALRPEVAEYLLAFADDEHMIGAHHAAWIGLGPFLEEDLAFCSIAQDELGHAIALYQLLVGDADHATIDRFGLLRDPSEYRSCWLAEQPCDQWSDALVRHWLYDRAEMLRWEALTHSSITELSELAAQAIREEAFHLSHAALMMGRISSAGGEAVTQLTEAIDRLRPLADGLWDPVEGEAVAVTEGVTGADSATLGREWGVLIDQDLAGWGLSRPAAGSNGDTTGGQQGRTVRSEQFAGFQRSLQEVISLDPTAVW